MVALGSDSNRGPFTLQRKMKIRDILDGMSNTILMAERDLGNPSNPNDILGRVRGGSAAGSAPSVCIGYTANGFYTTGSVVTGALMSERWACGLPYFSAVTIAVPPNGGSCMLPATPDLTSGSTAANTNGFFTPSSRHTGGVQVLMGDGTVRFVNETLNSSSSCVPAGTNSMTAIDSGKSGAGAACNGQSPFGIWGALGTIASGETVNDF